MSTKRIKRLKRKLRKERVCRIEAEIAARAAQAFGHITRGGTRNDT